jgi:hypothetical protein
MADHAEPRPREGDDRIHEGRYEVFQGGEWRVVVPLHGEGPAQFSIAELTAWDVQSLRAILANWRIAKARADATVANIELVLSIAEDADG